MKPAAKAPSIFDRILGALGFFSGVLIVFMMLAVSAEVTMRHFFNRPIFWMIEVTQWQLVFILFLGAAWVLKKEGHVAIDLLVNMAQVKTRRLINGITSIICAITCLVITWYGVRVSLDYFQIHYIFPGTVKVPAYLLAAVVPLGTLLFALQFLRRAYGFLKKPAGSDAKIIEG
jgi:TRAP-type C4-dicarboxylate transport system permease small subunit